MLSLHQIGLKHGTDKATFHGYLDFYEKHLPRDVIKNFLEIGVLEGSSLRTWREWLKEDTIVEGWDISPPIEIDGCVIKQVDQSSRHEIFKNSADFYDVILDDGGHLPKQMQTSFSMLFPKCRYYIIEDLHAPWVGKHYLPEGDENTIDLVENLSEWSSKYSTRSESEYIKENAKLVDIYFSGERSSPTSMTAIIRNMRFA